MPKNEFGVPLDRNGYAPSIMNTQEGVCFLCGWQGRTERHEVLSASLRTKSKEYGLWVNLCSECHRTAPYAVHQDAEEAAVLRHNTQLAAMETYGWSMQDWMERFYKNYTFMED